MKRIIFTFIALVSLTMLVGCTQGVTVTFVENGGTSLTDLTVDQGNTIEEVEIEKEGYTFNGWFEDESFTTAFDFDTEIVRNMTLYASWSINSYTVTFVFNNDTDDYSYTGEYTSDIVSPEEPTKTGYIFGGWFLDSEFETEFESTTIPSSDTTVYGYWIAKEYTVNFYIDSDDTPIYSEVVTYGEDVLNAPALPVVTGYDTAWSEDITNVSSDLEVSVEYTIQDFEITFNDFEGNTYEILTVEYGDTITPTSTPTRAGYDFIGYYSTELERNIDLSTYTVTSDLVLEDSFQIQTYTVMFFGGEDNSLLGDVQYIDYLNSATSPTEGLDKAGYTFTGWSVEFDAVTGDLSVYAEYSINQYTVTLDANGGVYLDASSVVNLTQDYNSNVTVSEVPTKAGFVFVGWYSDLTYSDEVYFGTGISMPIDGFTVYAKWVELVATTYTVSGTYYFEQVGISTDELSLDGIYTQTSSEVYTSFVNVLYDTDMSAVRSIEGYEFYKYVYNGVDYFDASNLVNITSDTTIDVYYRRIVITVSFVEVIDNTTSLTDYYTYYNGSLTNVPTPSEVSGMTVAWDQQNFENLKEDLEVTAIQYDNSLQTVIFTSNGSIIYISTNDSDTGEAIDSHAVVLTADSPLWDMELEGYLFLGWYVSGTDTLVTEGIIYFDDAYFTSSNITTLEARWLELEVLKAADDISMNIDTNNDTITINFTVEPVVVDSLNVYPTDFTFILNGVYIQSSDVSADALINYITQTGDDFTLTLTEADAYYDLFKEILYSADDNYESLIAGTHTLQIISEGDDLVDTDSDVSSVYQFTVESIYDGIPESVTTSSYYLIEDFGNGTLRYVFYSNLTYQFDGMDFTIVEGSDHITADGNQLTTSAVTGEFIFTITDEEGSRTYYGLVVEDIRQFDIGSSYQNYLTEINVDLEDDQFLNESTDYTYNVGASNGFYLDILITDNNGAKITLEDVLLDYLFYLNDSETALTETELVDYVEVIDNIMYFTELAIGNSFTVSVEPTYEATLMDMDALEYTIYINDGYNAFTNDELKELYSDLDVNLINLQRDIEASLSDNQMYEDGSPINFFAKPTNDYENYGNVYYRVDGGTDDDSIVIEGNFMTVDGSDIECINAANDGFGTISYADGFDIVSTQIGIFYYNVYETETINNNTFTMNNLKIIGNTTTPSVNYGGTEEEITYEESLMSQNSGGMLGVVVRNGDASLNNLVIGYTVIGVTTNAYGINSLDEVLITDLDYVQIYDSWANSVYLWSGSGVSLDNCDIGSSGGAAIHFEDTHSGTEVYDNPQLILSETTEINNWISGSEAWFKAYGMSSVALVLKSSIDTSLSGLEKTIIQIMENPVTGLDTEMMNFVFLSLPNDGAVSLSNPDDSTSVITASEVTLDITSELGNTYLDRAWNFTEQVWPISATESIVDPRVMDGQFAFAVGDLSDTYSFLAMITDIMTEYYGMTGSMMNEADAGQLAYIAGFYNLTSTEALQVAGYMGYGYSIQGSIIEVKGSLDYSQPQYIEVVAPIALTGAAGNATILIEMFNEETE